MNTILKCFVLVLVCAGLCGCPSLCLISCGDRTTYQGCEPRR